MMIREPDFSLRHNGEYLGYRRTDHLSIYELALVSQMCCAGVSYEKIAKSFNLGSASSVSQLARKLGYPPRSDRTSWRAKPDEWAKLGEWRAHASKSPCAVCGDDCDGSLMKISSQRTLEMFTSPEVPRHSSGYGVQLCHLCQRRVFFKGGFVAMLAEDVRRDARDIFSKRVRRAMTGADEQNFEQTIVVSEAQMLALAMLRAQGIAAIPRAVCSGAGLYGLQLKGLIQRSDFIGLWEVTDQGREASVVPNKSSLTARNFKLPDTPDRKTQRELIKGYKSLDTLKPGDLLFGEEVRKSALDRLEGKPKHMKWVYFTQPLGVPLKHIAWTIQEVEHRGWIPHNASRLRRALGLPERHAKKPKWGEAPPQIDDALYDALLAEGCSPEEIKEYYATKKIRTAIL